MRNFYKKYRAYAAFAVFAAAMATPAQADRTGGSNFFFFIPIPKPVVSAF